MKRTKLILDSVALEDSLRILRQKDEGSVLIGGLLFEMLSSTLEDRGYDYSKRVLVSNVGEMSTLILNSWFFLVKLGYFQEINSFLSGTTAQKVPDSQTSADPLQVLRRVL